MTGHGGTKGQSATAFSPALSCRRPACALRLIPLPYRPAGTAAACPGGAIPRERLQAHAIRRRRTTPPASALRANYGFVPAGGRVALRKYTRAGGLNRPCWASFMEGHTAVYQSPQGFAWRVFAPLPRSAGAAVLAAMIRRAGRCAASSEGAGIERREAGRNAQGGGGTTERSSARGIWG
jgi:hypothetical protein